jgi:hypothetical protein
MLRRIKIFAILAGISLIVIQLYRPERTNPRADPKQDIHATLAIDPQVDSILKRSCNDCHSNQTVWPWYSRVAPTSWLVVSDVNRGRVAVNFSEWSRYSTQQQRKHLGETCSEVSQGEMPATQYTIMHPSARLSASERTAFCQWAKTAAWNRSETVTEE